MKFGNFLLTYQPPQLDQKEVIKRLVNLGQASESCGFDTAWLLEHHFTEFGLLGNPYVAAANLLGATKKLHVGTAAVVLPTAHPVRQLEDVNLLDQMSKGRFKFGICRGLYDKDFRVFGTDMSNSRELMNSWYDIMTKGMIEGHVSSDNEHIKFPKVKVSPNSYTQRGAPVYVVAESASTTEWAAERGLPIILSWIINNNEKKSQLDLYNEIALEHGHDVSNIDHCMSYITSVDHNSNKAKDICRDFLAHWYDSYLNATSIFDDSNQTKGYDFNKGQWRNFVLKGHKDTNRRIDYSYEINPVGTPQECIEIIQSDIDATGIHNICCGFEANGSETEIIASMKLFQSDVMPYLKEKSNC
uniref:Alkanal monooxygenase alpha chain n=1 Tax=Kryptophanaron alfredi symbiont TaxID=28177 RepID=LUXA_KRYAS|nr:RecName: Full=Alkanal monooxygenase alpha chain; AltName: Full=Bacterial luciferase alpha chain [Kryptophanaron alfredi symbiont]pir/A44995/ alkanal monooxygenase (FMN-linked) (EC 1.14.14.3) alpha chain - flashlight fish symbiont bacterium [flashlight fish symbiont]AAA91213.1 luciferase-alpha subunit [Kryptophanaron alfredi symbiont]